MIDRRIKRNQHYVPQSYLRRFTLEGEQSLIWEFDKKIDGFLRNPSSVNRICCEDYYYYQIDESGMVDHIRLEDAISDVERIGNNIISDVINMSAMPYVHLDIEKKAHLSYYIAFMQTRGPAFRNAINDLYGNVALRALDASFRSGTIPEPPGILKKMIEEKGLHKVLRPAILTTVSLWPMIESARIISHSLLSKQWTVLIACNEHQFITSDNPVTFYSKTKGREVGPGGADAITIFPLSPKLCILIEPKNNPDLKLEINKCNELEHRLINNLIYNSSMCGVFMSSKQEWLKAYSKKHKSLGQIVSTWGVSDGFDIVRNPFKKR